MKRFNNSCPYNSEEYILTELNGIFAIPTDLAHVRYVEQRCITSSTGVLVFLEYSEAFILSSNSN